MLPSQLDSTSECLSRESLLKGKAQYSWPPCTNFFRFWYLLIYKRSYHILSSIMCIQVQCAPEIDNDFWKKKFLFFKNNFKRNNHCKFIHHKSYLKPFLSYLPQIVRSKYFSIIFNIKKCALYLIKYGKLMRWSTVLSLPRHLVFPGLGNKGIEQMRYPIEKRPLKRR